MAGDGKGTGTTGESAGRGHPAQADSDLSAKIIPFVDKRSSRLRYGEFDNDPETYKKTPNRLANAHFPIGQDLGDEGTSERDKDWVNLKLEVVEGPPPVPDQKGQLNRNGPEIKMKCTHCRQPLRIGGSMKAKQMLEAGGFKFDPYQIVLHASDEVAACVCPNGHVTQLRMEFAMQLRV